MHAPLQGKSEEHLDTGKTCKCRTADQETSPGTRSITASVQPVLPSTQHNTTALLCQLALLDARQAICLQDPTRGIRTTTCCTTGAAREQTNHRTHQKQQGRGKLRDSQPVPYVLARPRNKPKVRTSHRVQRSIGGTAQPLPSLCSTQPPVMEKCYIHRRQWKINIDIWYLQDMQHCNP